MVTFMLGVDLREECTCDANTDSYYSCTCVVTSKGTKRRKTVSRFIWEAAFLACFPNFQNKKNKTVIRPPAKER